MAVEDIAFWPPSAGPYPLVRNEVPYVPHEYYQCGDSEWCLHEVPDESPFYEVIPMEDAPGPKIFGKTKFSRLNPDTTNILQRLGFSERDARTFGIRFYKAKHQDNGALEDAFYQRIVGKFHDSFDVSPSEDGKTIVHWLAVDVRSGRSLKDTNHTVWHELGHAYYRRILGRAQDEKNVEKMSYHDDDTVKKVKRIGKAILVSSTIEAGGATSLFAVEQRLFGSVLLGAAAVSGVASLLPLLEPRHLLWCINKEERFCEKFAQKHAHTPLILG